MAWAPSLTQHAFVTRWELLLAERRWIEDGWLIHQNALILCSRCLPAGRLPELFEPCSGKVLLSRVPARSSAIQGPRVG